MSQAFDHALAFPRDCLAFHDDSRSYRRVNSTDNSETPVTESSSSPANHHQPTRMKARFILLACLFTPLIHAADEASPPSKHFDLSHWKLTLPVDAEGTIEGKGHEVSPQELAGGYMHPGFFYANADGALVFWSPVVGAITENTEYARSELREMIDPSDDNVCWPAKGTHTLDVTCRVIEVPSEQKVVIGQIHGYSGKANPLVKLQFFKGRVEALVKDKAVKGKDLKLTFPDVGLDKDFDYQIKLADGVLSVTVNGTTQSENVFELDPAWAEQTLYFKIGVYPQDNEGPETEGARAAFSKFSVSHAPAATK